MDQSLINEKRKQVLVNPSSANIDILIQALTAMAHGSEDKDIAFLNALKLHKARPEPEYTSISPIPTTKTNETKFTQDQTSTAPTNSLALASLNIPATAQWSFINGLGDMEWIQGQCVRRCLEDRVVHAQALPNPKEFEVFITGRFQQIPNTEVSTPFHNIDYSVEAVGSAERGTCTCYHYHCEAKNEANTYGKSDILFELVFSVSSGDHLIELTYSF